MAKCINLPITKDIAISLIAGESLLLSGKVFVMRDAAHKRVCELLDRGENIINFKDATLYYMGPCPAKDNEIIGSCGPTTGIRMDKFAGRLYDIGVTATIGKGDRGDNVYQSIVANNALYLAAIGGCGALYQQCVTESKFLAFPDLGAEALLEIEVNNFPVIVAIDSKGNSIFPKN